MTTRVPSVWSAFLVAALMAAIPTEPDKSMANAHESFIKGDMNKAAEHIQKAAAYVHEHLSRWSINAWTPPGRYTIDLTIGGMPAGTYSFELQ